MLLLYALLAVTAFTASATKTTYTWTGCGGIVSTSTSYRSVIRYKTYGKYSNNEFCVWSLLPQDSMDEIQLEISQNMADPRDGIVAYYRTNTGLSSAKLQDYFILLSSPGRPSIDVCFIIVLLSSRPQGEYNGSPNSSLAFLVFSSDDAGESNGFTISISPEGSGVMKTENRAFRFEEQEGEFSYPGNAYGRTMYDNNERVSIIIQAPTRGVSRTKEIILNDLNIHSGNDTVDLYSFLPYYSPSHHIHHETFSGNNQSAVWRYSVEYPVLFWFQSDENNTGNGFSIQWRNGCGGTVTISNSYKSAISYKAEEKFSSNEFCVWSLLPQDGISTIELEIRQDINDSQDGIVAYLWNDGLSSYKLNRTDVVKTFNSSLVFLAFSSDGTGQSNGFTISITPEGSGVAMSENRAFRFEMEDGQFSYPKNVDGRGRYDNNERVSLIVQVPTRGVSKTKEMIIEDLNTESESDFLYVYSFLPYKSSSHYTYHTRASGTNSSVLWKNSIDIKYPVLFWFDSNHRNTGTGFTVQWINSTYSDTRRSCGGTVAITNSYRSDISYKTGVKFSSNEFCVWTLLPQNDMSYIRLEIRQNITESQDGIVAYFFNNGLSSIKLSRTNLDATYNSSLAFLVFSSDRSRESNGFTISITPGGSSGVSTPIYNRAHRYETEELQFTYPKDVNRQSEYDNNERVRFIVQLPTAGVSKTKQMTLKGLDTEASYDFLYFYSFLPYHSSPHYKPHFTRISGTNSSVVWQSSIDVRYPALFWFHTDGSGTRTGFTIQWRNVTQ